MHTIPVVDQVSVVLAAALLDAPTQPLDVGMHANAVAGGMADDALPDDAQTRKPTSLAPARRRRR